jgi:hypothetical protein
VYNFKKLEWFHSQPPHPYVILAIEPRTPRNKTKSVRVLSAVRCDFNSARWCNILNGRAARQRKETIYQSHWLNWDPEAEWEKIERRDSAYKEYYAWRDARNDTRPEQIALFP